MQRLTEMAGNRLHETLTEQFGAYLGDLKGIVGRVENQHEDKARTDQDLQVIEETVAEVLGKLEGIRGDVATLIDR